MEEYKVSQNFLSPSVDQSSILSVCDFLSFPFWMSQKRNILAAAAVLPPGLPLCLPLSISSSSSSSPLPPFPYWNLWENQANSSGPICVPSSRFYCNSCKVGGDCGKIALMHSHCILLYVILKEKRELLIPWVKLTISIKRLWRGTDCVSHYSRVW